MATRPAPTEPIPERIVVIGGAGSGKTTLARALAVRLGARHIELDALGDDEAPGYATQVAAAIAAAGSRWVFDGAPYNAELLVYPHADTVVALDYPRRVVQRRVLTRSIRHWLTRRGDGAHTSTSPPWRWWAPDHPVGWATRTHAARHGGDCRVVRTARTGPCAPAAVHLAPPGGCVAGQPEPVAGSISDATSGTRVACSRSAPS
jgi:hypothetical protein